MFNQLRSAISPRFKLAHCIQDWPRISKELSESPRNRSYQNNRLYDILQHET